MLPVISESIDKITINSGSSTMLPREKWKVTHFIAGQILALGASLVVHGQSERIDISGREDGFKDGISVTSKKKLGGHFESGCNAGYGILIFHSIPELNYLFEKYITHYEER